VKKKNVVNCNDKLRQVREHDTHGIFVLLCSVVHLHEKDWWKAFFGGTHHPEEMEKAGKSKI
jgi:hypothetical protein